MDRRPAFGLQANAMRLYRTVDPADFATQAVDSLSLDFGGIVGDRHAGTTRRSGGREPWYQRRTEIRNERQVSLVCAEELAMIAGNLGVPEIRPEWLGANVLIAGIPDLTLLPPGSGLFFTGGATIRIQGLNTPCRKTGRALAARYPDRSDIESAFVKAARDRRGLVGWVEKPGAILAGESIEVRVTAQRLYSS